MCRRSQTPPSGAARKGTESKKGTDRVGQGVAAPPYSMAVSASSFFWMTFVIFLVILGSISCVIYVIYASLLTLFGFELRGFVWFEMV